MAEPFLSEIRVLGFNWAPVNWAKCDGQVMPIAQNQALYSLLGTNFGGDGRTNFNLPDMRGRTPVNFGTTGWSEPYKLGESGGIEYVNLSLDEMAYHTHPVKGTTSDATKKAFAGSVFATSTSRNQNTEMYSPASSLQSLNAASVSTSGAGGSHSNIQPFLVVNYCIAIKGLFPSRN